MAGSSPISLILIRDNANKIFLISAASNTHAPPSLGNNLALLPVVLLHAVMPCSFPLFFVTLSVPGNCTFLFYYIKQEYFQDMYSCALELVTFKGQ